MTSFPHLLTPGKKIRLSCTGLKKQTQAPCTLPIFAYRKAPTPEDRCSRLIHQTILYHRKTCYDLLGFTA